VIAGDYGQLTAVESGGGMQLLADEIGYVQLAQPVRFQAEWEQDASLGLRAGQLSALDQYDLHGQISGGDPDDMMEAARRAYVSHYLDGTDVTLIALERARCRELSRRIRDELIHLKLVDGSREVTVAGGVKASAGDVIICRTNDRHLRADGDRSLANGDVLRIEQVAADGTLTVRLRGDRTPDGSYLWAPGTINYRDYHTDEPALQRRRNSRRDLPLLASGPDRRPAHACSCCRDAARRGGRLDHPGGVAAGRAGLRPRGRRRPDSPGRVDRPVPAEAASQISAIWPAYSPGSA
jgi:hypothetical protein